MIAVAIPARLGSTRLPGKLLHPLGDGTVLSATVAVARAAAVGRVFVLADDDALLAEARRAGAEAVAVRGDFACGTDRVAAGLDALGCPDRIINLQGDAAFASPAVLHAALDALRDGLGFGTVAMRAADAGGRVSVTSGAGCAIRFSRDPLPPGDDRGPCLRHVGVYAYRRDALRAAAALPPSAAERAASLEQLRWLDAGWPIGLAVLDGPAGWADAVDTAADLRGRGGAVDTACAQDGTLRAP